MQTQTITLTKYWNANKIAIKSNWKKEFIRAKYGYSMLSYINSITNHILSIKGLDIDMEVGTIERELYRTI